MTDAPDGAARKAVRLRVTGRVQGVGYRDWMVGEAASRGLSGWVRNREDGSVEAVVAGPAADVDAMTTLCRRGPRWAKVDEVAAAPAEDPGRAAFSRW